MEQAALLEMPETDFCRLITELEKDSLFQRLYRRERIIRLQRFPGTRVASAFYRYEPEVAGEGQIDLESLLSNQGRVSRLIKRLGVARFNRFFLFPESGMSLEEIARGCRLTLSQVKEINRLIDDFSIMSEFYHPSALSSRTVTYTKIASIEKSEGRLVVGYFSPYLARGRYAIDYERFEQLKAGRAFTVAEVKEAQRLFKKLELVNTRKDTLTAILNGILERQRLYLESGEAGSLLPFNQRELARQAGLSPSSVSRGLRGKSIETPQGKEIPLKHLFPSPRRFRQELLRRLLQGDHGLASDEAVRNRLREKFGIAVSRRSVANLRRGLKIPPLSKPPEGESK